MTEYGGVFIGKELGKQSQPNDERQWKQWKLKFQPKEGQQYGFGISMFEPQQNAASLDADKLVEGKYYKVDYGDGKINPQNNKPYKKFISITEAIPGSVADIPAAQNPTQNTLVPNSLDLKDWEGFGDKYFAACKKHNKTPDVAHMIGSYMKTYNKQYIEKLLNMVEVLIQTYEAKNVEEEVVV